MRLGECLLLSCALVSVACARQSAVDRSPKEKVAHAAADSARAIDAGIEAPTDGAGRAASAPLGVPNNFGTICDCPTSEYSNGSGRGRGIGGLGPVRAMPATVTPDTPKVRGGLDREIIRRKVRPHLPELLSCYEPAVARRPRLAGQIEVEITIAPSGDVSSAVVRRSTVHDSSVVSCFVAAIRDWKFLHSIDGQKVIASQRFTLTPPRGPRPWRPESAR